MKLFKKVLAVALVGAMAVSMLTACGESSKTADVKKALKDVGVTTTKTMNKETNRAADKLQSAAAAVTADPTKAESISNEVKQMTEYSFAHPATGVGGAGKGNGGAYDLYIWTNGVKKADALGGGNYPYLYRVDPIHVSATNLSRLLAKDFVKQGVFSGSDESMKALQSVLTTAKKDSQTVENLKVGISCQKVYGYDVLLVTVPSDIELAQTPATTPVK